MAHPIDIRVGQNIRRRRWMAGMTQKQLAEHVGIKFQQIQKYETGANRVSASRLFEIAQALDISVAFFFESDDATVPANEEATGSSALSTELFQGKESIELLSCYYQWPEEQRRHLFELTRSMVTAA